MKNCPACKKLKKGLANVRLDDEQLNALVRLHSWLGSHVPCFGHSCNKYLILMDRFVTDV